mgnify:CR=1 FL=1
MSVGSQAPLTSEKPSAQERATDSVQERAFPEQSTQVSAGMWVVSKLVCRTSEEEEIH